MCPLNPQYRNTKLQTINMPTNHIHLQWRLDILHIGHSGAKDTADIGRGIKALAVYQNQPFSAHTNDLFGRRRAGAAAADKGHSQATQAVMHDPEGAFLPVIDFAIGGRLNWVEKLQVSPNLEHSVYRNHLAPRPRDSCPPVRVDDSRRKRALQNRGKVFGQGRKGFHINRAETDRDSEGRDASGQRANPTAFAQHNLLPPKSIALVGEESLRLGVPKRREEGAKDWWRVGGSLSFHGPRGANKMPLAREGRSPLGAN